MSWGRFHNDLPPQSRPCLGHTRKGDDCRKSVSPKNPNYAIGWCGTCVGPAESRSDTGNRAAGQLWSQLVDSKTTLQAVTRFHTVTETAVQHGSTPQEAVNLLLHRTLGGNFDSLWHAKFGGELTDVGQSFGEAVHAVAPFDDPDCWETHKVALEAVAQHTDSEQHRLWKHYRKVGSSRYGPEITTNLNEHGARDLVEGFNRASRSTRPHPKLLAHLLAYKSDSGWINSKWSHGDDDLVRGFVDQWTAGEITPGTVDRDDLCGIVRPVLTLCPDQDLVAEVMEVADDFNEAEIAAGRPNLFDRPPFDDPTPESPGWHYDPYQPPSERPKLHHSHTYPVEPDPGVVPVVYNQATRAGDRDHFVVWPAKGPGGAPSYATDDDSEDDSDTGQPSKGNPADDWRTPHSVGRWLTLAHPPQSMLQLGAWHTEHAATVAEHPAASPQQQQVARLVAQIADSEHGWTVQHPAPVPCTKLVVEGRGRWVPCSNTSRNPTVDGWCGRCTMWMLREDGFPNNSPYQLNDGYEQVWAETELAHTRPSEFTVDQLQELAHLKTTGDGQADTSSVRWQAQITSDGQVAKLGNNVVDTHVNSLLDVDTLAPFNGAVSAVEANIEEVNWLQRKNDPDQVLTRAQKWDHSEWPYQKITGTDAVMLFDGKNLTYVPDTTWGALACTDFTVSSTLTDDESSRWAQHLGNGQRVVPLTAAEADRSAPDPQDAALRVFSSDGSDSQTVTGNRKVGVPLSRIGAPAARPWALARAGLLDLDNGHVVMPEEAPTRGGVAVFDRRELAEGLLAAVVPNSPAVGSVPQWVRLTGSAEGFTPEVSTLDRSEYTHTAQDKQRQPVHRLVPLDGMLFGVAAPAPPVGPPPDSGPRSIVRQGARPVQVAAEVVRLACEAAERHGSDVVTVAWDDGLSVDDHGHVTATSAQVHFDCDPRSEQSKMGITATAVATPLKIKTRQTNWGTRAGRTNDRYELGYDVVAVEESSDSREMLVGDQALLRQLSF